MEEKDEQVVDAEYQAEFNKLAEGSEPSKDEPKPKAEGKEPEPDPAKEPEKSGEGEPKTEKSEQDDGQKPDGDETGVAKALKDTKAWATKLAMEKSNLEKEVAALKAGKDSAEKIEAAKASVGETRKTLEDKVKRAAEDYPELKEVLDLLANTAVDLSGKVQNFEKASEEESKRLDARKHFEADVEPEIIKVHPDFRKVAFSKEFISWLDTQSPAMQYAAMNSLDPRDINMSLTEYKKSMASGDSEKMKAEEKKRKDGLKENLSGMRGGGSVSKNGGKATKLEDVDPNDREAAFEFLASQEGKKP